MFGLSTAPLNTLFAVSPHDRGDGTFTLIYPDGQVVSCQPNGTLEKRPPGTDGGYETCRIAGSLATYAPLGAEGSAYVFALTEIPNA